MTSDERLPIPALWASLCAFGVGTVRELAAYGERHGQR